MPLSDTETAHLFGLRACLRNALLAYLEAHTDMDPTLILLALTVELGDTCCSVVEASDSRESAIAFVDAFLAALRSDTRRSLETPALARLPIAGPVN